MLSALNKTSVITLGVVLLYSQLLDKRLVGLSKEETCVEKEKGCGIKTKKQGWYFYKLERLIRLRFSVLFIKKNSRKDNHCRFLVPGNTQKILTEI